MTTRTMTALIWAVLCLSASTTVAKAHGLKPGTASPRQLSEARGGAVHCVAPGEGSHFRVIYAYGEGAPNRVRAMRRPITRALHDVSGRFDRAARRSGGPSLRLPVRCQGNRLSVETMRVPVAAARMTSAGMRRHLSRRFNPSVDAEAKYVVYYDGGAIYPGRGLLSAWGDGNRPDDTRPGADNEANNAGHFAIQFGAAPSASLLMHEIAHTMGAVQNDSPNTSGNGHCNDGQDVMCYSDGGPASRFRKTLCSVETFDCGGDDYFNPRPTAGSYLATHWNLASPANRYLHRVSEA